MKLVYDKSYWQDYYDGPYDQTFQYGFPFRDILASCWNKVFDTPPESFADIGSGPGQTLIVAETILPNLKNIYGVECQAIPAKDLVHPKVIIADFLEVSKTLEPVDFLYAACSMYVPWQQQAEFMSEVLRLSKKAVCFANVYLTDAEGIPHDIHRKVIYKNRKTFTDGIESLGWKRVPGYYDFFVK